MRLAKALIAFLAAGIAASHLASLKLYECEQQAVCEGTDEIPSDVAFATMLLKFGKYFFIIAIILILLFM
jgi:hypothetical protein